MGYGVMCYGNEIFKVHMKSNVTMFILLEHIVMLGLHQMRIYFKYLFTYKVNAITQILSG